MWGVLDTDCTLIPGLLQLCWRWTCCQEQFGFGTENVCVRVCVWTAHLFFFYVEFAYGPSVLIWTGTFQWHSKSVRLNFKCAACVRHQALLGADGSWHKGQFHTGWRLYSEASSFLETWSFLRCTGYIQCRGFCGDCRTLKKHSLKTFFGFFVWQRTGNIVLWSFKAWLSSVCT